MITFARPQYVNENVQLAVSRHLWSFQVAQMERAYSRLQSELEHYRDSNQTQEKMMEGRLQAEQTQKQVDSLNVKLCSLQSSHDALR